MALSERGPPELWRCAIVVMIFRWSIGSEIKRMFCTSQTAKIIIDLGAQPVREFFSRVLRLLKPS